MSEARLDNNLKKTRLRLAAVCAAVVPIALLHNLPWMPENLWSGTFVLWGITFLFFMRQLGREHAQRT